MAPPHFHSVGWAFRSALEEVFKDMPMQLVGWATAEKTWAQYIAKWKQTKKSTGKSHCFGMTKNIADRDSEAYTGLPSPPLPDSPCMHFQSLAPKIVSRYVPEGNRNWFMKHVYIKILCGCVTCILYHYNLIWYFNSL